MKKGFIFIAALAVVGAVALIPSFAGASGHKAQEPEPQASTVPPMGPGEDYKSEPAPGEALDHPPGSHDPAWNSMSMAQAQRLIDPGNSPSILICKIPGGGFAVEHVRWASPEAAARFHASSNKTRDFHLVNDGGTCEE